MKIKSPNYLKKGSCTASKGSQDFPRYRITGSACIKRQIDNEYKMKHLALNILAVLFAPVILLLFVVGAVIYCTVNLMLGGNDVH